MKTHSKPHQVMIGRSALLSDSLPWSSDKTGRNPCGPVAIRIRQREFGQFGIMSIYTRKHVIFLGFKHLKITMIDYLSSYPKFSFPGSNRHMTTCVSTCLVQRYGRESRSNVLSHFPIMAHCAFIKRFVSIWHRSLPLQVPDISHR